MFVGGRVGGASIPKKPPRIVMLDERIHSRKRHLICRDCTAHLRGRDATREQDATSYVLLEVCKLQPLQVLGSRTESHKGRDLKYPDE